jgi:uncharacterized protein involved in tolerance to divalent cations
MKLIHNKRGDKILSIYWFAILLIIAGGIFGMVYVFYGTPYDVREIETRVLTNQIADCVSYTGKISSNLILNGAVIENDENFLKQCHLNFDTSEWEIQQIYVDVKIYRLQDLDNPLLEIEGGNVNLAVSCSAQENNLQENLATCLKSNFYSLDNINNQYIIKILTAVRKAEKNVKI